MPTDQPVQLLPGLVLGGMLDAELAALAWLLLEDGVPVLVAGPGGRGADILVEALVAALPAERHPDAASGDGRPPPGSCRRIGGDIDATRAVPGSAFEDVGAERSRGGARRARSRRRPGGPAKPRGWATTRSRSSGWCSCWRTGSRLARTALLVSCRAGWLPRTTCGPWPVTPAATSSAWDRPSWPPGTIGARPTTTSRGASTRSSPRGPGVGPATWSGSTESGRRGFGRARRGTPPKADSGDFGLQSRSTAWIPGAQGGEARRDPVGFDGEAA